MLQIVYASRRNQLLNTHASYWWDSSRRDSFGEGLAGAGLPCGRLLYVVLAVDTSLQSRLLAMLKLEEIEKGRILPGLVLTELNFFGGFVLCSLAILPVISWFVLVFVLLYAEPQGLRKACCAWRLYYILSASLPLCLMCCHISVMWSITIRWHYIRLTGGPKTPPSANKCQGRVTELLLSAADSMPQRADREILFTRL
jgi:hypothetical protein